ncbi:MAG: hypothetical protein ACLFSQ_12295 [Candidatus Zixiibacteriota bacterium]
MRKHISTLILCIIVSFLFAEIPSYINYQGKVTDSDGIGITNELDIQASIYDVETGGTSLWDETHTDVDIRKGMFAIMLGSINPIDIDFGRQLYLELTIDGDVLSPRILLASEAYAFHAKVADSLAGHSADEDDITDNNIGELANVDLEGLEIGQTIVWDGTNWLPGDASVEGGYNTYFYFNDGTNELTITDGDGSLIANINNEADDLSNNVLDDLMDVHIDSLNAGRVLVYNGSHWVPGDPSSATDNQIDTEVPTSLTGDFEFATSATNVHQAIDDLDQAIGNLDDGDPVTTRVSWYDISSKPPGFADDEDAVDYIATVNYSDATNQLVITDGGGAHSTTIDNEADDLTDNNIGDIGNVSEDDVEYGNILQYTATGWVSQNQTDGQVDLSATGDFELIGSESQVHGALDYLDNAIYSLNDHDTTTTAISWADIRTKPDGFRDNVDNVDDADHIVGNEYITSASWNETANEITISDEGDDHIVELTGFSEEGHVHQDLIDGDGIVGGVYNGSTETTWDILPGRGLEIFEDSVRLSDDFHNGQAYEGLFISTADTAEGDIAGNFPDLTVRGIQGNPVSDDEPSFGSLIAWDGAEWGYTTSSLMWGDSSNFIKPLSEDCSPIKIYDIADSFMVKLEHSDDSSSGKWYGLKLKREGHVSSKGYGIYSEVGSYADLGADTTVSEFWGVYGKAQYGKRNYGVYGIANDVGLDCLGYGVYGEGQTAGGQFIAPEPDGIGVISEGISYGGIFEGTGSNSIGIQASGSDYGAVIIGPENDGENAVLKIQNDADTMLIDADEIVSNGTLYLQNDEPNKVAIGVIGGDARTALHAKGGFALGERDAITDDYSFHNSIQLATTTIDDDPGDFDDHTGLLMYADLDSLYGTGNVNFHIAEDWREYIDEPALSISQSKSYLSGKLGVGTNSPDGQLHVQAPNPGVEDQAFLYYSTLHTLAPGDMLWQSFIAGLSGYLVGVTLQCEADSDSITFRITDETAGGETVAERDMFFEELTRGMHYIEFPHGIPMTAGRTYKLHIINQPSSPHNFLVGICNPGGYDDGECSLGSSYDLLFATYVADNPSGNFVVTEDAKVGIGTKSPEANLEVYGTVSLFDNPEEIETETEYYAETDGFIVVAGQHIIQLVILADTHAGLSFPDDIWSVLHDGTSTSKSLSCPIPKGYYFQVTATGSSIDWFNKKWIPMGKK